MPLTERVQQNTVSSEPTTNIIALRTEVRPGNNDGWPRTHRQHDFCFYRVIEGMNIEQAALKAGYSEQMARTKAATVLKGLRPYCEHLQELKNKTIEKQLEITAESVTGELATIAFVNVLDYLKPVEVDGIRHFVGKAPDELTDAQARAVAKWRVEKIANGDEVIHDYRYEFYDKKGALVVLGKHLGMFNERLLLEARIQQQPRVDLSAVPDEVLEKWMSELQTYQQKSSVSGDLP